MPAEKEEISIPEYQFQIRDIEVQIMGLTAQIEQLALERDRLNYSRDWMIKSYEEFTAEPVQEVKPKKLKKTDDQLSKNHTEVQN